MLLLPEKNPEDLATLDSDTAPETGIPPSVEWIQDFLRKRCLVTKKSWGRSAGAYEK